jgi:hypothetical protein
VFLHLQPYKQTSLKDKTPQKLAPKFYGPYEIIQHIGQVAYKLGSSIPLQDSSSISCVLSKEGHVGSKCKVQTNLPELDEEGSIWLQLEVVLDTKEHQLCQCMINEVLIQWKDMPPKDATWEPTMILQQFPHLQP